MYTIIDNVWHKSMKLHQLVELRNELQEAIELSTILQGVQKNQDTLNHIIFHADEKYGQRIADLAKKHARVIDVVQEDLQETKQLVEELNAEISHETARFFHENYQTECMFTDPREIRNHKLLEMAEGSREILESRVALYCDWKYATLEIGCRDGDWTKKLIAADPLYITDIDEDFLVSTVNQFTKEYQARLRKYLIKDYQISNLPINQFGFIFSYNFFNYLSLDSIKQFLIQAYQWLKPGGVMMFTYNNADMSASAGMCEGYFMTYVPKSMLVPMIESLGYEIISAADYKPSTSWIEIRKPGILKTVKAHQALGEIVHRG
jgi:SAM-dependent methyltransferase